MRAGSPLSWGSPPFWILTLSEANLTPLFESHPNWCLQILWNTLKWWCYILYYTKSIESVIIITLYTFRLNSVFTTDSLVRYCLQCFFLFDMQEEWTWNIPNNYIIKSDVWSLVIYQHISYHAESKKGRNISTRKTHQMPNNWQHLICIKASFSHQNLQNDKVTPRL